MNYPRALAAVQLVGEQLGERLGGHRATGRLGRVREDHRGGTEPDADEASPAVAADYYALLGVTPAASDDEIKRAYRRMARELHPDTTGGDAVAEAQFKEVTRAYEVLRDPERRARYDRFGPDGVDGPVPGAATSSAEAWATSSTPSSAVGSGPCPGAGAVRSRGADAEVVLELELPRGRVRGRAASHLDGHGRLRHLRGHRGPGRDHRRALPGLPGLRRAAPGPPVHPRPGGDGRPLPALPGSRRSDLEPLPRLSRRGPRPESRTFTVDVPAGVDHGSTLRLTGRGPAGPRGGPAGDLYVHLAVQPDDALRPRRQRPPRRPPRLDDPGGARRHRRLRDPRRRRDRSPSPGTQGGHLIKLRGRGVPHVRGRGRGDLSSRWSWTPPPSSQGPGGAAPALGGRARRGRRAPRRGPHVAPALRLRLSRRTGATRSLAERSRGPSSSRPPRCAAARSSWPISNGPSPRPTTPTTSPRSCACGRASRWWPATARGGGGCAGSPGHQPGPSAQSVPVSSPTGPSS